MAQTYKITFAGDPAVLAEGRPQVHVAPWGKLLPGQTVTLGFVPESAKGLHRTWFLVDGKTWTEPKPAPPPPPPKGKE
jgi:hypothetical protein